MSTYHSPERDPQNNPETHKRIPLWIWAIAILGIALVSVVGLFYAFVPGNNAVCTGNQDTCVVNSKPTVIIKLVPASPTVIVVTATPIPTLAPTPTPVPPTPTPIPPIPTAQTNTYTVSVSASQDSPGVITSINLRAGQHIHITATGTATYGYDYGNSGCNPSDGYPITHPDGSRTMNGNPCTFPPRAGLVCPNTSVGMLCANFGQGFFYVGADYTGIVPTDGALSFLYSDGAGSYGNNTGAYTVTITITG